MCDNIRIVSNNIWWSDNNKDAWKAAGNDSSAKHRADGFFRVYTETNPDIIGLQECTAVMTNCLMTLFAKNNMPYALLWGRDTPVIYRKDKFELVDSEAFVYSESVPGFEGCFNNDQTKSYCIAVLRNKESGKLLIFASTHLWYKSGNPASGGYQPHSDDARAYQLGLLTDRLIQLQKIYDCPAVVVGDFNAHYSSLAVRQTLEKGFVHAYDVSQEQPDDSEGMHRCDGEGFDETPSEGGFQKAIDHVLVCGDLSVRTYKRYIQSYYMPLSDHFPVVVDVSM